jgi:hypothetical protein
MKTTYVLKGGQWVNKATGEPMVTGDAIAVPYIASDIKPYFSVASGKMVDGRAQRREDLKRTGCRETDPSEYKVETARTKKWAKILNVPHVPDPGPERMKDYVGPVDPSTL